MEADLPDSASATAYVSDDHPPKLLGTAAEHRGSLSEQRVTGGAAQKVGVVVEAHDVSVMSARYTVPTNPGAGGR